MRRAFVRSSLARGLDLAPERLLVEVVVLREPGKVLARALAEHPARESPPGERAVDAAERLDADEVTEREDVERNLEAKLSVDVARRVRALAGLVVLNDPARAERVEVDPVDLPGEPEIVTERQARAEALEPRGRSRTRPRACAGRSCDVGRRLVAQEALEVRAQRVPELGLLQLGEIEPDPGLERVVETAMDERDRCLEVLGRHALGVELARQLTRRSD